VPRGKKTGGRQKGTPNKHKRSFREALRTYCEEIGVDPHHYMANIIADESTIVYGVDANGEPIVGPAAKPDLKLQAAKELAQYLEPKLKAMDMEISGNADKPLVLSIRRAH
jgi:hypothetical protein